MARPRKVIDPILVEKLAAIHCTIKEIASVCDCSVEDLPNNIPKYSWEAESRERSIYQSIGIKHHSSLKRLRQSIRQQIIDRWHSVKYSEIENIIGNSIPKIAERLENTFKPGMSWFNYGDWQIDHIKPRKLFKQNQIKEAFNLNNLQALWKRENLKKGSKWQGPE